MSISNQNYLYALFFVGRIVDVAASAVKNETEENSNMLNQSKEKLNRKMMEEEEPKLKAKNIYKIIFISFDSLTNNHEVG